MILPFGSEEFTLELPQPSEGTAIPRNSLTLDLDGSVRLTDRNGRDLTPRGRKARGRLVLLSDALMTRKAIRRLLW